MPLAASKAYNGNIMQQNWITSTQPLLYSTYTYDKLNRLTWGGSSAGNSESVAYDLMGNITTLNRQQAGTYIDQLAYTYTNSSNATNQLQSITDATASDAGLKHGLSGGFLYDGNGNLVTDPSKSGGAVNIAYNLLNLPQNITGSKTITYTYDAAGNKLRRVSANIGNTDYINGIQYDQASGASSPTISFVQTEEGKATPLSSGGYDYIYYLGDNLGNTRVTFDTKTGAAAMLQQDDYYPFGYEISTGTVVNPKNEYLYNKKELQEELSEYDYGARFYNPVIGRWNVIDPLAEISRRWSPYNYVENDPIRLTDPDGMITVDGPMGTTIDVSSFNHWSSNGGILGSNGKTYSRDAFAKEFPGAKMLPGAVPNPANQGGGPGDKNTGPVRYGGAFGRAFAKNMEALKSTGKNLYEINIGENIGKYGKVSMSLIGNSKKGAGAGYTIEFGNKAVKMSLNTTVWDNDSFSDVKNNTHLDITTPFSKPQAPDPEEWNILGHTFNPSEIKRWSIDIGNSVSAWFKTMIFNGRTKQGQSEQLYGN